MRYPASFLSPTGPDSLASEQARIAYNPTCGCWACQCDTGARARGRESARPAIGAGGRTSDLPHTVESATFSAPLGVTKEWRATVSLPFAPEAEIPFAGSFNVFSVGGDLLCGCQRNITERRTSRAFCGLFLPPPPRLPQYVRRSRRSPPHVCA
jgi:hypothetical protein